MLKVKCNNKTYIISDCLLFCNYGLEVLDKLFHINKDDGDFFFILKWFYNTRIVQKLLEYGIYDILVYLRADVPQSLLWSIWILFSNNDNIEFGVDCQLDNFGKDSVILLFFSTLGNYSRISIKPFYYILDFFFSCMPYIRLAYWGQFLKLQSFFLLFSKLSFLFFILMMN